MYTDLKTFHTLYWVPTVSPHRSCRLAPLIQCDYCPLLFHMDCLDPPLTALPAGKWMCPNHVEHLVVRVMALAQSKTSFFSSHDFFKFVSAIMVQQNDLFSVLNVCLMSSWIRGVWACPAVVSSLTSSRTGCPSTLSSWTSCVESIGRMHPSGAPSTSTTRRPSRYTGCVGVGV